MAKIKKLNPRQWLLYTYIKNHGKVSTQDICRDLSRNYTLATDPKVHNPCVLVNQDVDAINASGEIEKIIIHDRHYHFWLATSKNEAIEFAVRLYKQRAVRALKKYYCMVRKANADGQGKIVSCQDKPIDEHSEAREFVEAFVKEANG